MRASTFSALTLVTMLALPSVASADTPADGSAATTAADAAACKTVMVHIEANSPVTLEMCSDGEHWEPACESPCNTNLRLDVDYRIGGNGIRRSNWFRLSGAAGQSITLRVIPGSQGGRPVGVVLMSVGCVAFFGGAFVLLTGALVSGFGQRGDTNTTTTAGVFTALGGIVGLAGIGLSVASPTSVAQVGAQSPPPARDAWLRAPSWLEAPGVERAVPKTTRQRRRRSPRRGRGASGPTDSGVNAPLDAATDAATDALAGAGRARTRPRDIVVVSPA